MSCQVCNKLGLRRGLRYQRARGTTRFLYPKRYFPVRHGLHPSLLEKEDLDVINEVIGKEWYKRFGYVKEDLDNIVTVPKELPIPDYR